MPIVFHTITVLCLFGLAFCIMMLIRNQIIARHRMRALLETSKKGSEAIERGERWEKFYNEFHACGTYQQMLWQFNKWSYEDFYGELFKEESSE